MSALVAPATGHPPSDGAHRLAWWLAEDAARPARLELAGVSPTFAERLLTGEAEPIDMVAEQIAAVTGGAVRPDDWMRGGPLGWTERPYARES
jgi:hypothetical protein